VQQPRFPTALPPVWNLPFRRNPAFTGREQELAELADQLARGRRRSPRPCRAAVEWARPRRRWSTPIGTRSRFDTVWWVRAEQPASLVGDYADLAGAKGCRRRARPTSSWPPGRCAAGWTGMTAGCRSWTTPDSPETPTGLPASLARLVDLIPQVLHGQVLVTSRDAS
jgi:hypothetical protein